MIVNPIPVKNFIYNNSLTQPNFRLVFKDFNFTYLRSATITPILYMYFNFKDGVLHHNISSSHMDNPFDTTKKYTQLIIHNIPTTNDCINAITNTIILNMHQPKNRLTIRRMLIMFKSDDIFNNTELYNLQKVFINEILNKRLLNYAAIQHHSLRNDLLQYYFAVDKIKYFEIKFGLTLNNI